MCCLSLLLFSRLMLFSFICCVSKFQLSWWNWSEGLRLLNEMKTNALGFGLGFFCMWGVILD